MKPRALILRAAGSNCDRETEHAFQIAGANTERLHINRIAEQPSLFGEYDILAFPGGFTYGDDIAAGKILANELSTRISEPLHRFVERGSLVIGICNGFQVLMKTGLLPGGDSGEPRFTLTDNVNGSFEARWAWIEPASPQCAFTKGISEPIYLPIAHGEGRLVSRDEASLDRLEQQGQVAFRYTVAPGEHRAEGVLDFPANPSGSMRNIAGICDPTGRVMGMMPHPERHIFATQHPQWTRIDGQGEGHGMQVFRNAVAAAVDYAAA